MNKQQSVPPTCEQGENPGFTLIETLVAVAVLLVAIAAPLTLMQRSLSSATASKDNVTAGNLARDALEYVKNVRDTNLLNETDPWITGLEPCLDQTCTVDTTRSVSDIANAIDTVSPGSSDFLRYDTVSNRYGYDTGQETPYRREVTITTLVPDREYRVEVEVAWENRGIPHTYRVGQNLFELVSAKGCSTPAINGMHVGVDPNDPNYAFLDCGMLLHYTFDDEDGATSVADSSGFGNDGVFYGGVISTAPGVRGDAIDLDGADDKVRGPSMDLEGDFTMTAWINGNVNGVDGFVAKRNSYKVKAISGEFEYNVKAPDGSDMRVPALISAGTWHHIALRFDSSGAGPYEVTSWLNGALVGSNTTSGNNPASTDTNFVVGCFAQGTDYCFDTAGNPTAGGHFRGLIDDVRIYGRTLDDWEIQALADDNF